MDKAEYMLTNYHQLKEDLEILEYRLRNFKPVTENEVISSLVFHRSDEPKVSTTPNNQHSEMIALSFREQMVKENEEQIADLTQRYLRLAKELEVFEMAVRFLKGELAEFAHELMKPNCNWDFIMREFHISRGTVYNWRQKVLDHIRQVYIKIGHSLEMNF